MTSVTKRLGLSTRNFSDENALFAHVVLNAALEANDSYMALSGGENIHTSGVELYLSAELAKALVMRKAEVDGIQATFAQLEATGYLLSGHETLASAKNDSALAADVFSRRADIALMFPGDREKTDPREPFCVIEVKRHLDDIHSKQGGDVQKIADLLDYHARHEWHVTRGCLVAFDALHDTTRKQRSDRIDDLLQKLEMRHPELCFETAWLARANPLAHATSRVFDDTLYKATDFVAYLILVRQKST